VLKLGVVTTSRADYGIYQAVLQALEGHVDLRLFAGGSHLVERFGNTLEDIRYPIAEKVDMLLASDGPASMARGLGLGVLGFTTALERSPVDLLLVLGDRFEMLAAGLAALPLGVPLAHLHGGEATFGALDDSFRHALTKLSHLHFAATDQYAARIRQLGEEPWRVHVSGAPGLDGLLAAPLLALDEFESRFGANLHEPTLLATYHPATLGEDDLDALLVALEERPEQILWTAPNADAGGQGVRRRLEEHVQRRPRTQLVASLGLRAYATALRHCRAMVGNSSSGLIEAPSFELPVVNLGRRQEGRIRAENVIDCSSEQIREALQRALSPAFREGLRGLVNPYGDGRAAERIRAVLLDVEPSTLLRKRFTDL